MTNSLKSKEDLIELFKELNESLFNYFFFRVFYNKEVAEDLTSELFLKIWNKREHFDSSKSSLKTWIYSIARNHLIDYIRKEGRIDKVAIDNEILSNIKGRSDIEEKHLFDFVIETIDRLDDENRELIVLRYIIGLEIDEIAKVNSKSYNATKVAIYRSIQKLKDKINGE
ncbi:sigma-70 family RNA polymerase sigma factor [Candidatus Dojkabacteria bacterium]|uniref:Sigma-70 family RNA polymerase sigma factor n=1 Tax=Candidatus Dojkabacteria bacterium TaxID=2099670 RepID=A0A955RMC5_9BACT|nr:sigma-70 family RNA polymerase sigma factor [Candidatus Dojkabacteria bacterium]